MIPMFRRRKLRHGGVAGFTQDMQGGGTEQEPARVPVLPRGAGVGRSKEEAGPLWPLGTGPGWGRGGGATLIGGEEGPGNQRDGVWGSLRPQWLHTHTHTHTHRLGFGKCVSCGAGGREGD